MRRIYTLICFILLSCNITKQDSDFISVGSYRTLDQLIPYPYLLEKKQDTLFLFNNKGKVIEETIHKKIKPKDTIKFKDYQFLVFKSPKEQLKLFNLSDTTTFQRYKDGSPVYKYLAVFTKSENKRINKNIQEINKELVNSTWSYQVTEDENYNPNQDFRIKKELSFKEGKVIELTTYHYNSQEIISEYQYLNYYLFKIRNELFLSFSKESDNPQPIFQIIKLTNSEIYLRDFSSRAQKEKIVVLQQGNSEKNDFLNSVSKSNYYENCFDGYQGEYYYQGNEVTFNKGNEYLTKYIRNNAPVDNKAKEGYIIVHFNVNCNQKVGNFGLIQMTRNYVKTSFSPELINHLTRKVSKITDWPKVKSPSYKDVHAFLMVKIENGKITDLCP